MPTNACYRCGEAHQAAICRQHVINVRRRAILQSSQAGLVPQRQEEIHPVHQVEQVNNSEVYTMYNFPGAKVDLIWEVVQIGDQELLMKVDTGASLSVIIEETYCFLTKTPALLPTQARLRTYTAVCCSVFGWYTHHMKIKSWTPENFRSIEPIGESRDAAEKEQVQVLNDRDWVSWS